MDTVIPAQPREQKEPASVPASTPAPIDPVHDIDGFKVAIILAASGVLVFVSVWLLYHLFSFVIFETRLEQAERAPTDQLDQLRVYEAEMLQQGDAAQDMPARRMSIEEAMQELSKR